MIKPDCLGAFLRKGPEILHAILIYSNVGSHSPHLLISLGFEWVKYLHFKISKLKTMFVNSSSITGTLPIRA